PPSDGVGSSVQHIIIGSIFGPSGSCNGSTIIISNGKMGSCTSAAGVGENIILDVYCCSSLCCRKIPAQKAKARLRSAGCSSCNVNGIVINVINRIGCYTVVGKNTDKCGIVG